MDESLTINSSYKIVRYHKKTFLHKPTTSSTNKIMAQPLRHLQNTNTAHPHPPSWPTADVYLVSNCSSRKNVPPHPHPPSSLRRDSSSSNPKVGVDSADVLRGGGAGSMSAGVCEALNRAYRKKTVSLSLALFLSLLYTHAHTRNSIVSCPSFTCSIA